MGKKKKSQTHARSLELTEATASAPTRPLSHGRAVLPRRHAIKRQRVCTARALYFKQTSVGAREAEEES